MKNKKILYFLFIWVFLMQFSHFSIEGNSPEINPILDYTLNCLIQNKSGIEKVDIDYKFSYLLKGYIEFRFYNRAFSIYDMLDDEYCKYFFISEMLSNVDILGEKDFLRLDKLIKHFTDENYKLNLNFNITQVYLQKGDKIAALSKLKKLKESHLDENINTKVDFIIYSKVLINQFINKGMIAEAESLLECCEHFVFKENSELLLEYEKKLLLMAIIEIYRDLNNTSKLKETLNIFEKSLSSKHSYSTKGLTSRYLSGVYFAIEEYCKSREHTKNVFIYFDKIEETDHRKQSLMNYLDYFENNPNYEVLSQDKDIIDILKKNAISDLKDIISNDKYIEELYARRFLEFCINHDHFDIAQEIVNRMDKRDGNLFFYKDYYYYFLGEKYLEYPGESFIKESSECVDRITRYKSLKLDLLVNIAEKFNIPYYKSELLEIIVKVDGVLKEIKADSFFEKNDIAMTGFTIKPAPEGRIALYLIKVGLLQEAFKWIDKIKGLYERSEILYKAVQFLVTRYPIKNSLKILENYELQPDFKAQIISKIAAKYLIDGNNPESEKMFKEAIDMGVSSTEINIKAILNDYINARKYKCLVISED